MLNFGGAVEAAVADGIDEGEGLDFVAGAVGVVHLADEEDAFAIEFSIAKRDVLVGAVVLVHFEAAHRFEVDDEEVSALGDSAGDEGDGVDPDRVAEEEDGGADQSEGSPGWEFGAGHLITSTQR